MKKFLGLTIVSILYISNSFAQQAPETFTNTVYSQFGLESTMAETIDRNSVQMTGRSGNVFQDQITFDFGIGMGTGKFTPDNKTVGKFESIMKLGNSKTDKDGTRTGLAYHVKIGANDNSGWWDMTRFGYYIQKNKTFFMMSASPWEIYYDRDVKQGFMAKGVAVNLEQDLGERFNLRAVGQIRSLSAEKQDHPGSYYNSGAVRSAEVKLSYLLGKRKTTIISAGAAINDQLTKMAGESKNKVETNRMLSIGVFKAL